MNAVKRWTGFALLACVQLGCSVTVVAQATGGAGSEPRLKDDLFAGTDKFAQNATSVTEVDMDPDTLDMVGGHNSSRAKHTLLSVVHTYTYDKPGMYNVADVDAYRNKLNTGDWHCSVHVREMKSGQSTDVCRHHRTDGLDESAIITVEPKSLTFIHTIRRPYADGEKPDGRESFLTMPLPMQLDLPLSLHLGGDVPLAAGEAGMQANAAVMRAQGAIMRAEMAAVRPEMLAGMAEMRAGMASSMAASHADFYLQRDGDRVWTRMSAEAERSAREAQRNADRATPKLPSTHPDGPPL